MAVVDARVCYSLPSLCFCNILRRYATTGADTCVAPLLAAYSSAKDEAFAAALQQQPQLRAYGHCIVMPAADRILLEVRQHNR